MPERINTIVQEFINKIRELLGNNVKRIILYGSYARGDYNESSDVDIMILTDIDTSKIEEIQADIIDLAYDVEWDNNFNITLSPFLQNINVYNKRLTYMPFYMNVQKEGVEL